MQKYSIVSGLQYIVCVHNTCMLLCMEFGVITVLFFSFLLEEVALQCFQGILAENDPPSWPSAALPHWPYCCMCAEAR